MSGVEYEDDSFDTEPDKPAVKVDRATAKPKVNMKNLDIRANLVLALGIIGSVMTAIIAFVVLNIIFCTDLNCIGRIPFLGIIAEEDVFRPFSIILAVTTIALALSVCGSLSECRKSKRASAIKKKNTIGLVLSLAPIVALVIIYLC